MIPLKTDEIDVNMDKFAKRFKKGEDLQLLTLT